jgi:hypothetical protein
MDSRIAPEGQTINGNDRLFMFIFNILIGITAP